MTGSYFGLIDSCITQHKAQGPSRTCNESIEEEEAINAQRTSRNRASVRWRWCFGAVYSTHIASTSPPSLFIASPMTSPFPLPSP